MMLRAYEIIVDWSKKEESLNLRRYEGVDWNGIVGNGRGCSRRPNKVEMSSNDNDDQIHTI